MIQDTLYHATKPKPYCRLLLFLCQLLIAAHTHEMRTMKRLLAVALLLLVLAGCRGREVIILMPTESSLDMAATASVLTREAPPPGFDRIAFPQIDANTANLPYYRAEASLTFNGTFSRTPRLASAETVAIITSNPAQQARRVLTTLTSTLQPDTQPVTLDAVRLGSDPFLVRNSTCVDDADEALLAAQLDAAAIVGGIQQATVAPRRATLNGEAVWLYNFDADDLVLPAITLGDNSRIVGLSGELWVSPSQNVVVRYYLNLNVENITLFDQPLPVTGVLLLRYDLYLHDEEAPNISIPYGC